MGETTPMLKNIYESTFGKFQSSSLADKLVDNLNMNELLNYCTMYRPVSVGYKMEFFPEGILEARQELKDDKRFIGFLKYLKAELDEETWERTFSFLSPEDKLLFELQD